MRKSCVACGAEGNLTTNTFTQRIQKGVFVQNVVDVCRDMYECFGRYSARAK